MAHQRIGEVYLRQGQIDLALKEFSIYLEMARDTLGKDGENGAALFDFTNATEKVGDALRGQNYLKGREGHARRCLGFFFFFFFVFFFFFFLPPAPTTTGAFYFILFYFILFYFILLNYFILFYFIFQHFRQHFNVLFYFQHFILPPAYLPAFLPPAFWQFWQLLANR